MLQTQRDHDEAAHDRLAAIRVLLKCEPGEEAARVEHLATQYRLCRERLDQIEREAAEEEAEALAAYSRLDLMQEMNEGVAV